MKDTATDIVLINMPFCAMERPSLALGLLSAILEQNDIRPKIVNAQIVLMERIDLRDYYEINKLPSWYSVADWMFARSAFPDHQRNDEEYLHLLFDTCGGEMVPFYKLQTEEEFVCHFMKLRADCEAFLDDIADDIETLNPRIAACTSTFMQQVASIALFRKLKERRPQVITILGGANCETEMGVVSHKHFTSIDYVVSGEADDIIVPLINAVLAHGAEMPSDETPAGVFTPWHRVHGYPKAGGECEDGDGYPRGTAESLEKLPIPDYTDYFERISSSARLRDSITSCIPIEASRGCFWGKCKFCGLNGVGNGQRVKPTEQVVSEIESLARTHKRNRIEIVDNVMHPSHTSELLHHLTERKGKYKIFYEVRTTLEKSDIAMMTDAGICWVQAGIESLHSDILRTMNKGTEARHNIQLLKWARQFGVRSHWAMLYGFPGEKDIWYEEMAEILPLLFHLEPPGGSSIVRYSRYSAYFNDPDKYGLKLKPCKFYEYVYPLDEQELGKLVYYFDDQDAEDREKSVLLARSSRIGLKRVRKLVRQWQKSFSADSESRPLLMMVRTEPTVQIVDTRPSAKAHFFDLDEMQSSIYIECDGAKPLQQLKDSFVVNGVTGAEFDSAVAHLVENGLSLTIDGHLLSLALEYPYAPIVGWADFPMGYWRGTIATEEEDLQK